MFVSPNAENDSDFLLAADGFADEFDYVYVLYGNVPLMSGSSLKNALSLCVNEGNEAAAVFSRQPNGEDVTGAYVFSSKKLMTLIKNGASRSAEELFRACDKKHGSKPIADARRVPSMICAHFTKSARLFA